MRFNLAFSLAALQGALAGDTSDAKRSFSEICAENGFAFEQHTVITED